MEKMLKQFSEEVLISAKKKTLTPFVLEKWDQVMEITNDDHFLMDDILEESRNVVNNNVSREKYDKMFDEIIKKAIKLDTVPENEQMYLF